MFGFVHSFCGYNHIIPFFFTPMRYMFCSIMTNLITVATLSEKALGILIMVPQSLPPKPPFVMLKGVGGLEQHIMIVTSVRTWCIE
ncbi:unnamed protein product [Trifolium pratense]|uniref:Uncharacterized protein n=1 Tax=Trifolium pratense TaxID=57577 RepID=A0ACB0LVG4_TRIPR|nr:unnamed protein product [Trifolium pratense]